MTAITITTAATRADVRAPAIPAGLLTAARFLGHFLAAAVGVIFLGAGVEH